MNAALKNILGGLLSAGVGTGATLGAQALFGQSPEEQTAAAARGEAAKEADFRRNLELERQKHQWALEQIKQQTGTTDAQAAALLEEMRARRALDAQVQLANLDPRLYAQRASIDQANWERSQELNRLAGMEQTREMTRRKIESVVIGAWQGITEAQIKADAMMAQGMMNLAYAAGVPNPNVLQAGASFANQGAGSFGVAKSQI